MEVSLKMATTTAVIFQLLASVPLVLSLIQSYHISSHMPGSYNVYHNLAGATARMLMPAKVHSNPAYCPDDLHNVTGAKEVPLCGAALNHGSPLTGSSGLPYQPPFWALPDNFSELRKLAKMMVCFQGKFLASFSLCLRDRGTAPPQNGP
jgi:hypothetical protein